MALNAITYRFQKAFEDAVFDMKATMEEKEEKFLQDMIEHHQMALVMAKKVVASRRLGKFAQGIIDAQSEEIKQMEKWLKQWFDESAGSGMKM